jgi:hypothetical protein
MFRQLKNIDTAFKHVRSFSLLLIVACVAISVYALYIAHDMVSKGEQKIFVLANVKALEQSLRTEKIISRLKQETM